MSELELLAPPVDDDPALDAASRLRALVDRHYSFVWRSLRRLGVRDDALEDAAQQVLVVAARRLADIRPRSERSFLFGTALRVASDLRRAGQRRLEDPSSDLLDDVCDPGPDPEQAAGESDARRLLAEVLDAMPLELRTVFILFELEEMSKREVAAMLELPEGTVSSRLRRARELFEKHVARLQADERGRGGRA